VTPFDAPANRRFLAKVCGFPVPIGRRVREGLCVPCAGCGGVCDDPRLVARAASTAAAGRTGDAIVVEGLEKQYRGGPRALDGISLRVRAGEIFGMLGPNGAGKSTCVRILTTLAFPSGGRASVAGLDVLADQARVRERVGYVAQRSGVDKWATGRENLALVARLYGLDGRAARQRVAELLDRFGLEESADRQVRTFSGGMQRRLDVAMGLVHRPEVLFLDEPTTGLDPEHRQAMWDEVSQLASGGGLTIFLTTHYLEEADRLAANLVILDRGRIVAEGAPEALKAELAGDTVEIGLEADGGAPQRGRELLQRLPDVREAQVVGAALHARVEQGARAVPAIVTALEEAGLPVETIAVRRPSLDEVYLRYAGRSYAEADDAA
jgi:ABC-2 type transport system ATP-binding protein